MKAKKTPPTQFPPVCRQLQRRLAAAGWIALGSLMERSQPGPGGPRYQWSRRVGPKTITVALSAQQFDWLKTAIANQRQVWDTLMKMQPLTAEHMFKNLPNPSQRKRLTKKQLGLN